MSRRKIETYHQDKEDTATEPVGAPAPLPPWSPPKPSQQISTINDEEEEEIEDDEEEQEMEDEEEEEKERSEEEEEENTPPSP